jgi:hypothetical protein
MAKAKKTEDTEMRGVTAADQGSAATDKAVETETDKSVEKPASNNSQIAAGKAFMKANPDYKSVHVTSDGTIFPGSTEGKNNAINHQVRTLGKKAEEIAEVKNDE